MKFLRLSFLSVAVDTPVDLQPGEAGSDEPEVESVPELTSLVDELRYVTRRMRGEDDKENETNDWKFAAMVIDRLCFWVFSACLGLLTVVFLSLAASRLTESDHIVG